MALSLPLCASIFYILAAAEVPVVKVNEPNRKKIRHSTMRRWTGASSTLHPPTALDRNRVKSLPGSSQHEELTKEKI